MAVKEADNNKDAKSHIKRTDLKAKMKFRILKIQYEIEKQQIAISNINKETSKTDSMKDIK